MKIAFLGDIALVGQYNEKKDFDVSKSIDYLKGVVYNKLL